MSRPTEAQRAAAVERQRKFRALAAQVAAMPDDERAGLLLAAGAVVTVEGRRLSDKNTMLCAFQRPGVSMVGGFRQWIKAGRCVRKGEHGMSIWIMTGGTSAGTLHGCEFENEPQERRFLTGSVFDVSQTEPLQVAQ